MYSGFGWFVAEGPGFKVFMLQCFWLQGFGHCVGRKASETIRRCRDFRPSLFQAGLLLGNWI